MKTNTITTIVLVGILALSLAACSKSEAPTPKISERTEPPKPLKQQQPTVPPLNQEAVAVAEKAYSETRRQVDDSWFIFEQRRNSQYEKYKSKFIQIKGVTFHVDHWTLSEADTLNGVQWKGKVLAGFRSTRQYSLDEPPVRQWSDWKDGKYFNMASYYLEKRNGKWKIDAENPPDGSDWNLTKPSEEQIKSILTQ